MIRIFDNVAARRNADGRDQILRRARHERARQFAAPVLVGVGIILSDYKL
jgi:hypothetical protein